MINIFVFSSFIKLDSRKIVAEYICSFSCVILIKLVVKNLRRNNKTICTRT
jgi:hypothetical protein